MKIAIGILCILWIWIIYEWKNAPLENNKK
jgi:hypothetical protein